MKTKNLLRFTVLCLCFCPALVWAENTLQTTQKKLKTIQQSINTLNQTLTVKSDTEKHVLSQLDNLNQNLTRLNEGLLSTEQLIKQHQESITKTQLERRQIKAKLSEQQYKLSRLFRSFYQNQRFETLKLIANPNSFQHLAKNRHIHQYFLSLRQNAIKTLNITLSQFQTLEQRYQNEMSLFQQRQALFAQQQQQLKTKQQDFLAQLKQTKGHLLKEHQQLSSLRKNEAKLVKLITHLEHTLQDVKEDSQKQTPFSQTKTKLLWPVKGRVKHKFNDKRRYSKWDGIVISTPLASPIKASYRGQVVYANPLKGLGMLLIIDHGEGYMSLYGFNQRLNKIRGDWVETNETIAFSGHRNEQEKNVLYFGLRLDGQPINPANWLKAR
ncbi:MAG: peptidoglycan DD-metalloendopeptidase family protein [Methylococcales bacterium]|jgi:murein hydrolase activator|nr:peptidoglycan DD-metalloendopeptidase family protein [Methylococcales bacterium]MBT7446045.1 peptidoglycan DD-metalloendopeptidase family protein [Methylococcales bacterium]